MKRITIVLVIAAGLALTGCSSPSGPTVTITAEPAPAEAEAGTSVPQACIDALSEADVVITAAGEFAGTVSEIMDISVEAIQAAFYQDADGMDAATEKLLGKNAEIEAQNDTIASSSYATDRDACLAAAN